MDVKSMLKTKLTEMFGLKYPIVAAPMGPFYTTQLTVAVSEKGGLGVLSHPGLSDINPPNEVEKAIKYVIEHTDKPFGLNVRTARLQMDAPTIIRRVSYLINHNTKIRDQLVYGLTSAGGPKDASKYWKEHCPSLKHFHVAPSYNLAKKVLAAGCDGIVATGFEGGGHQSYEQINSTVLLAEMCEDFPDTPIIACGGFSTGRGLAAALAYGACGIACGTRFIASKECEFHPNYKQLVLKSLDEDTTISPGFLAPIRLLKNNYTKTHGQALSRDQKIQHELTEGAEQLMEELKAYEKVYKEGDLENGAIPAGESVGTIEDMPSVDEILQRMEKDAEACLRRAYALMQSSPPSAKPAASKATASKPASKSKKK